MPIFKTWCFAMLLPVCFMKACAKTDQPPVESPSATTSEPYAADKGTRPCKTSLYMIV